MKNILLKNWEWSIILWDRFQELESRLWVTIEIQTQQKNPYLLVTHIEAKNLLVEKRPDDTANEIITLATSLKDENHKVSVSYIV